MLPRIERLLRTDCAIEPGALLIAGVSGGPDSLCMLHTLHELGHHPIVAHFDHQLRPGSAAEAATVAATAASLELPFVSGGDDVAGYARSRRISLEEAGRILRYAFLFAQARLRDAAAVAVGHTADDQAETVLMHILRGSGLAGLRGMAPRVVLREFDASVPVIRPLLDVWREETHEYCRLHDLIPVQDASNDSQDFTRNRVRLNLIPDLESYNPEIRRALVRLARSSAADLGIIETSVEQARQRTLLRQGEAYAEFDAKALAAEAPALQKRLVMFAATSVQPGIEIDFEGLLRAAEFIRMPSGRRLELQEGVLLCRESGSIFVAIGEDSLPSDAWPQLPRNRIPVESGRATSIDLGGSWTFTLHMTDQAPGEEKMESVEDSYRGRLDADSLPSQLELRTPETGDRIQPLGMHGHRQKLSDVFINLGVPERLRARWPVLAVGDSVVWIPGFRIADPFRIQAQTRRAVVVAVARAG